jgi:predicted MFS family arabinose efflux permease
LNDKTTRTSPSLFVQLGTGAVARLVINTARRFGYTFAPALSRGLGLPLTAITPLLTTSQLTGLLSPVFGPLSDRWGHRTMILISMALLTAGMLLGGALPYYAVLLVAFFLGGLAKAIYDPALQAYAGEHVPYARRGRAIALIDLSWSGSTLLGIPLLGLLIEQRGWRAPFLALGISALAGLVALSAVFPRADTPVKRGPVHPWRTFRDGWRLVRQSRSTLAALGIAVLISAGADNFFVVYGAWLEQTFGLSTAGVGFATIAIGVAEALGELLTAGLSDKLGLKRAIGIGLILSCLSYLILPFVGTSTVLALSGLFAIFISFEFVIVTVISIFTELLPEARATSLSANIAAMGIGRIIGAVMGGFIWQAGGILAIGVVSAGIQILALPLLLWGMRAPDDE